MKKNDVLNAEAFSTMEPSGLFGSGNRLNLAISMLLWKRDEMRSVCVCDTSHINCSASNPPRFCNCLFSVN